MMPNNKIVLAYSGGLDTSFCIPYLKLEKGYEVHALTVNTGGFTGTQLDELEIKALQLGAKSFKSVDATTSFYDNCIKYLIYGNVLRNNTYPLSVSAERIFQALEVVQYAQQIGASAIAHGSTGAGNDQVRFDLVFQILAPEIQIITPIRAAKLSRSEEIAYLQQAGFDYQWNKAKYSINQGLWGTSVGGAETLTSNLPLPDSAYPSPCIKETPTTIQLVFDNGHPTGLNQHSFAHPIETITALQALAKNYAIGRDIHVGDTIIGIKGRVGFEAAAPLIIIKAHELLEKHVLSKWQQYWKAQLGNWYGMMLHEGQYLDPVMRNIEAFLSESQTQVSGTVHVQLHPYRFELQGITSPNDLMAAKFGQYGEMNNTWSGEEAKGFIKILANAQKIYHSVHSKSVSL